jgi:hypothetical protein
MAPKLRTPSNVTAELPEIAAEGGTVAAPDAPKKEEKSRKKKTGKKLSLHLPWELDFRLDNLANFQQMTKSDFALKLLKQGCGGYSADKNLRQVFAEISGQITQAG